MLIKLFTPQKLQLFEGGGYLKVDVAKNWFKIVFFLTFNLFGTSYNIHGGLPKGLTFLGCRYMKG